MFPHMSVYDNLLVGAYTSRRKSPIQARMNSVSDLFRLCSSAAISSPAGCPAANSKCSPLGA